MENSKLDTRRTQALESEKPQFNYVSTIYEQHNLSVFYSDHEKGIKLVTRKCHSEQSMRSCMSDIYYSA